MKGPSFSKILRNCIKCFHAHQSPSCSGPYRSVCSPSNQEGEPPRKKRRSKWDIQPPEATPAVNSNHEATPTQAPTSAAAAAAAKLNAKLASEGKLKPANAIYMVSLRPEIYMYI